MIQPVFAQSQSSSTLTMDNPESGLPNPTVTEYPDWFKTSFLELEDDVQEAADEGKRLALVFHQDGCPYCNLFIERNLSQKDIEEHLQTHFDVIEINMWGDREVASVDGKIYTEKTFAAALKVQFTPTVLFLTETGTLSLRVNGYYDPDKFRLALDYVTGKMESKLSFSEFIQQQDASPTSKELISREYFEPSLDTLAGRKKDKPYILLFEQSGCENCEILHDEILSLSESREMLENYDVYQVDMWGRQTFSALDGNETNGREFSRDLGVSYAPTMIVYSADGEEVIRSEAWLRKFHTQSILSYVATDAWRDQPSFQRFISARADSIREE